MTSANFKNDPNMWCTFLEDSKIYTKFIYSAS